MKRRQVLAAMGGAAVGWPLAAQGQQLRKPRRIAFVHSGFKAEALTETGGIFWIRRFYEELRRLGYAEGRNLVVERYSAEGRSDRYAALVAEVVSQKPDIIVSNQNALVQTFLAATSTIPIVGITTDPVTSGLTSSLARPGANVTGVSVEAGPEIIAKRLQIIKEAMPSAAKVTYLFAGHHPEGVDGVARRLGVVVTESFLPQVDEAQLRRSFAQMAEQRTDAILIDGSGSFLAFRALLVELAAKGRIPTIYPYRDYVEQGGLMAFAPDLGELAERMASDVQQILNAAKPGEIPFYLPSKFELIVNLKTAKTLERVLSPTLLARADQVIE